MVGRVFTVDRIADLTNKELDEVCGTVTVARGLAYAKHGHVVDLDALRRRHGRPPGWVGGSNGQTYTTARLPHPGARHPPPAASTSPAGTAPAPARSPATASTPWPSPRPVRERQPVLDRLAGRPTPQARPTWERALGGLLDDGDVEPEHTPVGILIEPAAPGPGRRAPPRAPAASSCASGPSCRACAAPGSARGSRGSRSPAATTASAGCPSPTTTATPSPPSPTPTAARCARSATAGCPTRSTSTTSAPAGSRCCAPPTAPACACSPTSPARARWRSRPTRPSSSSRSSAPTTAPSCTRASSCPPAPSGETRLVGQPATGFWLRDGSTLVLGALAEPLDGTRQRLLDLGVVEVPEADWPRFTVTHLPALRRKARVRSLSDDLDLPDAVPPRLALRVTFEAGHRAHLEWGFRYGTVDGGVLVPLAVGGARPDARPGGRARARRLAARHRRGRPVRRAVAGRRPLAPARARRPGCTGSRPWRSPSCCRCSRRCPTSS